MSTPAEAKTRFEAMHYLSRSTTAWTCEERVAKLDALEKMTIDNREAICTAIKADYGGTRPEGWSKLADVFLGLNTLRHVRANVATWMAGGSVNAGFPGALVGKARYTYEPLGVVLIMTPWNYPWHLAMSGLADALGAGNRVVLKPSEYTPATSALMQQLIASVFSADEVVVLTGAVEVSSALCALPFDHIMFTGGPSVGKLVAKAAAANLTPCTLELGGKCPVVIGGDVSLADVATIVINSKLQNAGQTCIAPDYVMVPKGKAKEFAELAKVAVGRDWGSLAGKEGYCGIINKANYDRVQALAEDAQKKGATVIELDEHWKGTDSSLRLPPKLVLGITKDMDIATEEIFGPIMGVVEYDDLEGAIRYVNERPRPLALYIFTHDQKTKDQIIANTVSGGVTVNGLGTHYLPQALPFGGVGNSGYGAYHGEEGFRTFSHKKPIFEIAKVKVKADQRGPPAVNKQAEFLINYDPEYYFETGKAILKVTGALAAITLGARFLINYDPEYYFETGKAIFALAAITLGARYFR